MHLRYLSEHVSHIFSAQDGLSVISHLASSPLHFLHNIQAAMHDELVHMSSLLCESRYTITALLGAAKLVLEEGIIQSTNDGEVKRHLGVLSK